ncbi:transmembrane amino acid transporter protein [Dictyocaulus viviparus]|uniref:Transmembrane amino acid transporter protein n=1 Tax=Dictyocaulus viviparus TaxID=29172 RepID=A0A0D8XX70_DICVI|nr:transmembrane amino acid transporter protein [Dictyocaulus viviparus]
MMKLVRCSHLLNELRMYRKNNNSDIVFSQTDSSDEERNDTNNSEVPEDSESDSDEQCGKKIAVNLCLLGLQVGICSVYYIFVVDHVKEIIDYLFSTDLNRNNLFFIVLPFFILLTSVRSIHVVSWIAFTGNVFVVSAIIIILVQLMFEPHLPLMSLNGITTVKDASVAAGSITYAFVAQGVVLPIENKMRSPQHMIGFCGVISTAVLFVGFLYITTGTLGYITYGDDVRGSITLNLTNSPLDLSVKVMLMLMTYCGYLIQQYPVVEMVNKSIEPYIEEANPTMICAIDFAIRYVNLTLSFSLAFLIPNLRKVIPFVGVTTGMMLSLVFPSLLESIAFFDVWQEKSFYKFLYNTILNIIYIILGLFFLCTGTYSNYKAIS